MTDNMKNLTVQQLRDMFLVMPEADMQLICDALRALAGDTESFTKLQRLHVSIEQGLHKLDKFIHPQASVQDYDPESRYFRPVGGFTGGKKFIEVRLVGDHELETLIHYHNGSVRHVENVLPHGSSGSPVFDFNYVHDQLQAGKWEELHHSILHTITDEGL